MANQWKWTGDAAVGGNLSVTGTSSTLAGVSVSGTAAIGSVGLAVTSVFTTNAQVGTTYTLVQSDYGKRVTFSNSSPIAVTLDSTLAHPFLTVVQNVGSPLTVTGASFTSTSLVLTSAADAVGQTTDYTGTITGGAGDFFAGEIFFISGFASIAEQRLLPVYGILQHHTDLDQPSGRVPKPCRYCGRFGPRPHRSLGDGRRQRLPRDAIYRCGLYRRSNR